MSLLPKTIYNVQRSSDGTAWEESYISGSNLVLQTSGDGTLIGSSILPSGVTASYALTASFVNPLIQDVFLTGSLNQSGSYNLSGSAVIRGIGNTSATTALTVPS